MYDTPTRHDTATLADQSSNADQFTVYLDQNDATWTSQRTYITKLAEAFRQRDDIRLTATASDAEIVHLNYLNPVGRVVHGKESLRRHLQDLRQTVLRDGPPVVVTAHGVEEFSDVESTMYLETERLQGVADAFKRSLQRRFGRFVDGIIAISSMDRQFLADAGFSNDQLYHVPHGVDPGLLDGELRTDGEFVLHVSKCSPHKNPRAIIETARRLDGRFVIAGKGWAEQYGTELEAIESVEVVGYVSEERLVDLYRSAAVCYFPSTYEPFGLPILESIACGTPAVASGNSGGRDLCEKSLVLVDPHDVGSHTEALRRLLANRPLRAAMGQAGRRFAHTRTWNHTADETLEVYNRVLSRQQPESRRPVAYK